MRTLEKVEGMGLAVLEEGLGYDWPFRTFPEYLATIEKRGLLVNAGVMIGHTPLRLFVMGEDATERTATPDELARMRALVRGLVRTAGARVVLTGRVMEHASPLLADAVMAELPGAVAVRHGRPPVLGALLLAFDRAGVPFGDADAAALAASLDPDARSPRWVGSPSKA
jgi:hypothetical protein